MTFYEIIKNELKNRGKTIRWMCEELDIDYDAYKNNNNNNRSVPFKLWVKISKFLNIDMDIFKKDCNGVICKSDFSDCQNPYEIIDKGLKEKLLTKKWLAEQIGVKYQTYLSNQSRKIYTVDFLVNVFELLGLDLNLLKRFDF